MTNRIDTLSGIRDTPAVLQNDLRARRTRLGLTQLALAQRCGVSRQTLNALEAGTSTPSATLALTLADALQCPVESLFWLDAPARLDVDAPHNGRLAVAEVNGRLVSHPIDERAPESALMAADALKPTTRGSVSALKSQARLKDNLLVVGCAPPLGLLSARLAAASSTRLCWVQAPSLIAMHALADGRAHLAGAHFSDDQNLVTAKQLCAGQTLSVFHLVGWNAGLVLPAGNPRRVRTVKDLLDPTLTIVRRDAGSAAQRLLERKLGPRAKVRWTKRLAHSHHDVAHAVAWGAADAGLSIEPVARALGLHFIPLERERFDLFLPASLARDERLHRVWDVLGSRSFRRELATIGGYDTRHSGHFVTEVTPS